MMRGVCVSICWSWWPWIQPEVLLASHCRKFASHLFKGNEEQRDQAAICYLLTPLTLTMRQKSWNHHTQSHRAVSSYEVACFTTVLLSVFKVEDTLFTPRCLLSVLLRHALLLSDLLFLPFFVGNDNITHFNVNTSHRQQQHRRFLQTLFWFWMSLCCLWLQYVFVKLAAGLVLHDFDLGESRDVDWSLTARLKDSLLGSLIGL